MQLTDVSQTAIITLRSRAVEALKPRPVIQDDMARYCLDRLRQMAGLKEEALLFQRRLPAMLTNHLALRARKYDAVARAFLVRHPGALYQFGGQAARELESYGRGIKVIDEWFYLQAPDARPRILKYLGLARTQWTVTVAIN